MNEARFQVCLAFTLGEEGGLSDDAADPGGRTNLGVTQGTLDRARKLLPMADLPDQVDELTVRDAQLIYRELYWRRSGADDAPQGVDLLLFDAAVQHDPRDAIRFMQLALKVDADGIFGPKTLAALMAAKDKRALIREMVARRTYYYMNLDEIDQVFGLGWSRRILRVYDAALGA